MRHQMQKRLTYEETIRFHGHDGPFLALGYKLGQVIVDRLKPTGIMDLKITICTRLEKPYTCLIDGLQCSTFATLGKGNLRVDDYEGKDISVTVTQNRRKLIAKVNKLAIDLCKTDGDLSEAVLRVFYTPTEELFEIKEP